MKWAPVAILVITAVMYSKAVFFQFLNFDDDSFIVNNALIRDVSLAGLKKIFSTVNSGKYNPLTTLSFALEYKFFGLDPAPYHVNNIILHLLSTWLSFKIAEKLSGSRVTASIVSLLFGIHPMHVEEVAWASERKDMLYAFFFLLAIWVYQQYISTGLRLKHYLGCWVLFIISLLAKSEAITLPVVLFAIDVYTQRKLRLRVFFEKVPFLLCSVVIAVVSAVSQQSEGSLGKVSTAAYGLLNRIFLFTSVPAFYVLKLFAPFRLSAMHYYPDMHHGIMPWTYYASLPFLALVVFLIIKVPSWSGPDDRFLRKELLFGLSFFVITICVMPQLISVGPSLTPERYTYIPYFGLFYIAGQWLARIGLRRFKVVSLAVYAIFVTIFCVVSWLRISAWKDSETQMTDLIEKNSDVADCSFLYWLRGNARVREETYLDAVHDFDMAIKERPGYIEAYSNRGAAHFKTGDILSAIRDYDSSILFNPDHARSYYNRASGKATIGDYPGALADFNKYLTLSPGDNQAYVDRGMVKLTLRDSAGACNDWKMALGLGNNSVAPLIQQLCR